MKQLCFFIVVFLLSQAMAIAASDPSHPQLRAELLKMEAEDQRYRQPGETNNSKADEINIAHLKRLKQIIDEVGWPGISMVGEDGALAAWLITQHADQDRAFQKQMLELIEPLIATGEVSAETYVYLYDRVNTPQRYGTQGECNAEGRWIPNEIENRGNVDSRRAEIGLLPLADYAELVSGYLCGSK